MNRNSTFLLTWNLVFWTVVCDAGGIFIIKLTMNDIGVVPISSWQAALSYFGELISEPMVLIGLFLFFSAPFLFAAALSRMDITTAYPVQVGLNFSFLVILAIIFLGESITLGKVVGLALICLSTILLYADNHKEETPRQG